MKTILLISYGLIAGAFAFADDIHLGTPGYGGSGCPGGSVATVLSPDAKSLSLLFDSYQVTAGGDTGRSFERKSCNVAIPVHIPQGLSVSVVKVDYRGYNNLPNFSSSQFNVEYFFAGSRGPSFRRNFYGPQEHDYLISNALGIDAIVWSPCGADTILRTNSSMRVSSNGDMAMSTVDSADVNAAIIYRLQWRRCF